MMKQRHSSLYAGAAIAAALAFGSTPALAQFADTTATPFPVVPEAAPPPAAAPVMTSSPVVQSVPDPAPVVEANEPAAAPAARAAAREAARERARTAAAPALVADTTSASEPVAVTEAEPIETAAAPVAAAPAEAAPAEAAPVEPVQASEGNGVLVPSILGGLAVLMLAIWGFVAIGRRKLPAQRSAPPIERPVAAEPIMAQPEPMPQPVAAPVTPTPIMARSEPAAAPVLNVAHSGASIALPRMVPETFAERNALLDRMIAARPDRANPFTSPIQRRKRAKLIVQSLGRTFDVEPWIDLSQYPRNWPELAHRQAA